MPAFRNLRVDGRQWGTWQFFALKAIVAGDSGVGSNCALPVTRIGKDACYFITH